MPHNKSFIEGLRYAFEAFPGRIHTVPADHPSPRGKQCDGHTVRIRQEDLKKYNAGLNIVGFCYGCGFHGDIQRRI